MREYEAEEPEPVACDPKAQLFRCSKTRRWPNLSLMARDILSIPFESAASERAFSGKDVFRISRMSLNPETVEIPIYLTKERNKLTFCVTTFLSQNYTLINVFWYQSNAAFALRISWRAREAKSTVYDISKYLALLARYAVGGVNESE